MRKVKIEVGPMCRTLVEQLQDEKVKFDITHVALLDKLSDSISALYVKSILTEKESDNAWRRLLKKVQNHIKSQKTQTHDTTPNRNS